MITSPFDFPIEIKLALRWRFINRYFLITIVVFMVFVIFVAIFAPISIFYHTIVLLFIYTITSYFINRHQECVALVLTPAGVEFQMRQGSGSIAVAWRDIAVVEPDFGGYGAHMVPTAIFRFRSGFDWTDQGKRLGWWVAKTGLEVQPACMPINDLIALLESLRLKYGSVDTPAISQG